MSAGLRWGQRLIHFGVLTGGGSGSGGTGYAHAKPGWPPKPQGKENVCVTVPGFPGQTGQQAKGETEIGVLLVPLG